MQLNDSSDVVVIPRVEAVSVYGNDGGEIVIRQEHIFDGEDHFIVFPMCYATAITNAILKTAGIKGGIK